MLAPGSNQVMASFLQPNLDILRSSLNFTHQPNHPSLSRLSLNAFKMGFLDAKNPVPHYQRFYQNAYNNHIRVTPRSRVLLTPYVLVLWGTFGVTLYGAGRKVLGYNSYFGS
ncbi:hypothetical protein NM208_g11370 [Fusarium decemcellulare]|uniref:Uncharacterized protein n=1 Tax=Fusarium decemcellulare TaxID=57161 RepID=A0ACC1RUH8_9HYPO|nr:hypothetical protein NM208_g11370 [Fusarium decemcellulare]